MSSALSLRRNSKGPCIAVCLSACRWHSHRSPICRAALCGRRYSQPRGRQGDGSRIKKDWLERRPTNQQRGRLPIEHKRGIITLYGVPGHTYMYYYIVDSANAHQADSRTPRSLGRPLSAEKDGLGLSHQATGLGGACRWRCWAQCCIHISSRFSFVDGRRFGSGLVGMNSGEAVHGGQHLQQRCLGRPTGSARRDGNGGRSRAEASEAKHLCCAACVRTSLRYWTDYGVLRDRRAHGVRCVWC